ncbi:aldo-keto reductase family 1 member D1 isoform X7 [Mus musculus]|uniref:aldo-keto reductase family 1 member D1 isoform X7 n=1 Tax=Mus musculus TaxID=10090 RepID=UPI0003D71453|nr:aldo-keto reductase family 1 member D1 isoform X7 [Mus musculus]|eukprot:XP_006505891.1 PREDICTED: 3-oxo-5-beta-steroid 4-dehydrogenase isoform X7 [Mus musculus]
MCLCPVQNHPRSFRFFSTMNLSAAHHQISLSDGNNIPLIGLGTYSDPRPVPGKTYVAVKTAIDEGYRHIDGAYVYHNEHEVGEAIREKIAEGKVKREEIFYCGKLWNTEHVPSMVLPALERTLKALKLDYIDLYIIELPMAFKETTKHRDQICDAKTKAESEDGIYLWNSSTVLLALFPSIDTLFT